MASISPPLPLSYRLIQLQTQPDSYFESTDGIAIASPSWIEKVLVTVNNSYKHLSGSFLRSRQIMLRKLRSIRKNKKARLPCSCGINLNLRRC